MINTKILKSNFNSEQYAELAVWANENGAFIEEYEDYYICEEEPTPSIADIKKTKVAQIKNYYDKRFEELDKAVLRRRLANTDISDLQTHYKTLQAEMMTNIKEMK